jgi:hypothetical protein
MANTTLRIGGDNWAVKEDNLLGYNVIQNKYVPIEMDVVRATTATRVNEQGLIEVVPRNLASYSEQFDNAYWNLTRTSLFGSGSISNATIAPNGTTTAEYIQIATSQTLSGGLFKGFSVINGTTYTLSVFAKQNDNRFLRLGFAIGVAGEALFCNFDLEDGIIGTPSTGITSTMQSLNDGWFRCTISATSQLTTTSNFFIYQSNVLNGSSATENIGIFIWGAQLEQGATAKEYFPTTDRLNIPRIDYSSGTASLLVEPQRTNLLLRSEEFDNAYWVKQEINVTANATTAPNGTLTADSVIPTTNTGTHQIYRSAVTSGIHTMSVYVKANGYDTIQILDFANGANGAIFNVTTGTVTNKGTGTGTIVSVGDGWYLCSATAITTGIRFYIPTSAGNFTGNGTSGLYLWGAQLEAGSYATSYIPTVASISTRNQDVISKTGISNLIGQTEGTVYAEIAPLTIDSTSRDIEISDGNNNRVIIQFNNTGIGGFVIVGGSTQASLSFNNSDTNFKKVILRYKVNDFALFVNGVKVAFDTSGITFPENTLTRLDFKKFTPSSLEYYGKVKGLFLWKTALTDQECINLTTL